MELALSLVSVPVGQTTMLAAIPVITLGTRSVQLVGVAVKQCRFLYIFESEKERWVPYFDVTFLATERIHHQDASELQSYAQALDSFILFPYTHR